ncbi:MAG TPA: hypothetical protein VGB09_07265 [Candidatus Binatia bacterium]
MPSVFQFVLALAKFSLVFSDLLQVLADLAAALRNFLPVRAAANVLFEVGSISLQLLIALFQLLLIFPNLSARFANVPDVLVNLFSTAVSATVEIGVPEAAIA